MASHNSTRKLSTKKVTKKKPVVNIDVENDFASIRLGDGIEAKSFEQDGILFSEDAKGRVIEIQILNLSTLLKKRKKIA